MRIHNREAIDSLPLSGEAKDLIEKILKVCQTGRFLLDYDNLENVLIVHDSITPNILKITPFPVTLKTLLSTMRFFDEILCAQDSLEGNLGKSDMQKPKKSASQDTVSTYGTKTERPKAKQPVATTEPATTAETINTSAEKQADLATPLLREKDYYRQFPRHLY